MLPTVAAAQEIPCRDGPCLRQRRAGTHFLAEINGGGSVNRDGGLALEGIFGVGGKVPGLPLRLYAITELAYGTSVENGQIPGLALGYRDARDYRDLSAGLRAYVPIFGPLRLFGDVLAGTSYQSVAQERDQLPLRRASGWSASVHVAGGLQLRLFHHLSFGIRTKVVLTPADPGALLETVGSAAPYRASITGGVTWHF